VIITPFCHSTAIMGAVMEHTTRPFQTPYRARKPKNQHLFITVT